MDPLLFAGQRIDRAKGGAQTTDGVLCAAAIPVGNLSWTDRPIMDDVALHAIHIEQTRLGAVGRRRPVGRSTIVWRDERTANLRLFGGIRNRLAIFVES